MMSMESISTQPVLNAPNNGIHRDDDYRKRILQSTCTFLWCFSCHRLITNHKIQRAKRKINDSFFFRIKFIFFNYFSEFSPNALLPTGMHTTHFIHNPTTHTITILTVLCVGTRTLLITVTPFIHRLQ